jgi:DNA mismatch endonuclease (patch repair protein)
MMAAIRGKNTRPELAFRAAVHALGARYRIHNSQVPGRPDISNRRAKVAVFIDGCFWHGCPLHYRRPSSRQDYWDAKLTRNLSRRQVVLTQLFEEKWRVVQVWECEVQMGASRIAKRVASLLSGSTKVYRLRARLRGVTPARLNKRPASKAPPTA